MTTPEDAAAVTQETARVMEGLEALRHEVTDSYYVDLIDAAIDRLIVLDNARQEKKPPKWATQTASVGMTMMPHQQLHGPYAHPREAALHQDAKRGNFRYQQEDDGA